MCKPQSMILMEHFDRYNGASITNWGSSKESSSPSRSHNMVESSCMCCWSTDQCSQKSSSNIQNEGKWKTCQNTIKLWFLSYCVQRAHVWCGELDLFRWLWQAIPPYLYWCKTLWYEVLTSASLLCVCSLHYSNLSVIVRMTDTHA